MKTAALLLLGLFFGLAAIEGLRHVWRWLTTGKN